jgi:hypothetical protein
MTSPEKLVAAVRKATQEGPYTVARTDSGFVLTAEVTGPPRARGRRHREKLTHVVVLDPEASTYRVTDTRETLGEAPEQGPSLLRLDKRAAVPVDPAVTAHAQLAEAAAGLGWRPGRATLSPRGLLMVIVGGLVLVLVIAMLLVV